MLVTAKINARNRMRGAGLAAVTFAFLCVAGLATGLSAWSWLLAGLGGIATYRSLRQRCVQRLRIMREPFPESWKEILQTRVRFYRALSPDKQERFQKLAQIFLSEVQITGVRTEIDETIRVLTAASAVIPIFGFEDWDYSRLREVLIYPTTFDKDYKTEKTTERDILGLTGLGSLSGVMILSKPALLQGFQCDDKENVGIHEFAHLVEDEEIRRGFPREVPVEVMREWVRFVAGELAQPVNRAHINPYGYTNEHEFFAVLAEYFFDSPELLREKDPRLYQMLREIFHQDPAALFSQMPSRQPAGTSAPCPCGSGRKFKECCLPVAH
ncbi:MAG: zinc-dependent peptidase [Planctomycetales bacterium]